MVGKSLLSSLSYLNSLLPSLGIKPFPAHHLLLAAANDPSATTSILSLLSDLVVFHIAFAPPPNNSPSHPLSTSEDEHNNNSQIGLHCYAGDVKTGHQKYHCFGNIIPGPFTTKHLDVMPMPDASSTSKEELLCFVKFYLALWGYPPSSPLFTLNSESIESRHLLLALGWLISHCDLFSRALEKRFSLFLGNVPVITDTYLDALAMESGKEAMVDARKYVAKVIAASNSLGESSRDKVKAQGEQLLMMCGNLRMTLRSLYALISCKTKRSHELNQMQLLEDVRGPKGHPFSPFELHLLEHQKTLEKYLMTLEMSKRMIKELVECNQQERDFWRWMGEVAAEAQQRTKHIMTMDQQLNTTPGPLETNLLPIVTYFRNELHGKCSAQEPSRLQGAPTSEGHDNDKRVASLVNVLPTPVMTMWKGIQERESRARSMSYWGTNNHKDNANSQLIGIFSSLHRHLLPREETCKSRRSQCLDWKKIKSVKDIATMLVSTLAKIRTKNKPAIGVLTLTTDHDEMGDVIQEALKVSMANKDHLFAGV